MLTKDAIDSMLKSLRKSVNSNLIVISIYVIIKVALMLVSAFGNKPLDYQDHLWLDVILFSTLLNVLSDIKKLCTVVQRATERTDSESKDDKE